MGRPAYDESDWPLVRVTVPTDMATDDEFATHLQKVTDFHQQAASEGVLLAILVDALKAPTMPVAHRREMGEKMGSLSDAFPDRIAGMAMVLQSKVQRGVITAITWIFAPPYPLKIFTEMEPAEAWLRQRLDLGARPGAPRST